MRRRLLASLVLLLSACGVPAPAPEITCAYNAPRAFEAGRADDALHTCADNGDVASIAALGMIYWSAAKATPFDPGNSGLDEKLSFAQVLAEGRRLIETAAEHGNANAQNELGHAYLYGEFGMPIDYAQALHWLTEAARHHDARAIYSLASMYYRGAGVDRSKPRAEDYLRRSASLNYAPAMCALAAVLREQPTTPNREDEARRLVFRAASQPEWTRCSSDSASSIFDS